MQTAATDQKTINIYRHGFYAMLFNNNNKGFVYGGYSFMNMAHYYHYYIAPRKLKKYILRGTCISQIEAINLMYYTKAKNLEEHIYKYDAPKTINRMYDAFISNCKQNLNIKMMLKLTGYAYLRYIDDDDSFLGMGLNGYGLNAMGVILMLARQYFHNKSCDDAADTGFRNLTAKINSIKMRQNVNLAVNLVIKSDQTIYDDMPVLLSPLGGPLETIYESDEESES